MTAHRRNRPDPEPRPPSRPENPAPLWRDRAEARAGKTTRAEAGNSGTAILDGVLVIDKPAGPTSHDVVATARRALGFRRIGHTGTLDPNASGVLPLVLGSATRLAQYLTASEKEYDAIVRFGVETDTYDRVGRVQRETHLQPTVEAIAAALDRFRGAFGQTPPPYSAKKVEGARAYDLARRAQPPQLAPAGVSVHALDLVSFESPLARLRIVCSSGFYVRSLAHDLGQVVGTGAILERLIRTRAGAFSLADAVPFAALAAPADRSALVARIIAPEHLLLEFPAVALTPEGARRVQHGQDLGPSEIADPAPRAATVRLISPEGRIVGLAEPAKTPGFLHPAVVFAVK